MMSNMTLVRSAIRSAIEWTKRCKKVAGLARPKGDIRTEPISKTFLDMELRKLAVQKADATCSARSKHT